jgi:hypothetical protein
MAQHDYIISNATFPAVRTDINNALSAIQTTNSGTSRPTGAVSGQLWLDTTSATTPTLKYYDGADDISLATIDHTANTVNWLDSTVSITGLSTTATGTVLTLSDSVNTTTVNLIIDNQKEIRFRETTANGTNYVALKAPASVASDLTFTLPATDGASGQALVTNGSGVLSFASAGISWQSVQTTGFTAVAGRAYPCNTTSSAFTVTLPSSASSGDTIILLDYAGTFATNNITLGRNSLKINGGTDNKALTTNREAVTLVYVDSTQGWVSTSASNYGTVSLDPTPILVDYLVVAGGGAGGGGYQSGGGGAGGMLTGTASFFGSTVYTATVGAGGTGVASGTGNSGSDSSISGTGLTTITSIGGGGGKYYTAPVPSGISGGSGGGVGSDSGQSRTGGSGTSGQGNKGGDVNGNNYAPFNGSGGGGKGAVGVDGSSNGNGDGGAGSASSITGSSVTYAGGGGGSLYSSGYSTYGQGGTGGGGNGGRDQDSYSGTAGTANTGGGGGGARTSNSAGNSGGSGVVILSVPTVSYSGTTTGSPTITTSGSNTIIKFTGTGSYTA